MVAASNDRGPAGPACTCGRNLMLQSEILMLCRLTGQLSRKSAHGHLAPWLVCQADSGASLTAYLHFMLHPHDQGTKHVSLNMHASIRSCTGMVQRCVFFQHGNKLVLNLLMICLDSCMCRLLTVTCLSSGSSMCQHENCLP